MGTKEVVGRGVLGEVAFCFLWETMGQTVPEKAIVQVGGMFHVTRQQKLFSAKLVFPWLSQDRPQLLLNGSVRRMRAGHSRKRVSLQTSFTGPPIKTLKGVGGWNGGGRQLEKLKTSITFHFLNLKQITVCGIYWSCIFFSFAKPVDSTND